MSKSVIYFRHDAGARNDSRLRAVRRVFGLEGYARFFILLELLREKRGFRLDVEEPGFWEVLTEELGYPDAGECQGFLKALCERFGLLKTDGRFFWSDRFNEEMSFIQQRKNAAASRWGKDPNMRDGCESDATITLRSAGEMRDICISFSLSMKEEGTKKKDLINDLKIKYKVTPREIDLLNRLHPTYGWDRIAYYAQRVAAHIESKNDPRDPFSVLELWLLDDAAKNALKSEPVKDKDKPFRLSGKARELVKSIGKEVTNA